jgi:hypothetical protein
MHWILWTFLVYWALGLALIAWEVRRDLWGWACDIISLLFLTLIWLPLFLEVWWTYRKLKVK